LIDGGMMIQQDMHFFCQFGMIQFQSPMMVCKGTDCRWQAMLQIGCAASL
jgi:hypothetical protein